MRRKKFKAAVSLFMAVVMFVNSMASLVVFGNPFEDTQPEVLPEEREFSDITNTITTLDRPNTNLQENPDAVSLVELGPGEVLAAESIHEVYRWEVEVGGSVYSFGLQEPGGIRPVVKMENRDHWYVKYEPVYANQDVNENCANGCEYVEPSVSGNVIEWTLSSGITAKYTVLDGKIKADYIVQHPSALIGGNKLKFLVNYNDSYAGDTPEEVEANPGGGYLTHELLEGDISWFGENGKEIFNFPKPVIRDSSESEITGNFEIIKLSQGTSLLSIVLSLTDLEYPIIIDPVIIDSATASEGVAFGGGRKFMRDAWGNLFVVCDCGDTENVYYKQYNSSSWISASIDIDGDDKNPSEELTADLAMDTSAELHVVYTDAKESDDLSYRSFNINYNGDNTVSSITDVTTEFDIDTSGSSGVDVAQASLVIANKGEGAGKEKVTLVWKLNTETGGTRQGEIRFLQCDVSDGCDVASEWKNASEEKNGSTDGMPSAVGTPGAADVLFQQTGTHAPYHTTHVQVPGRPQRTPDFAKHDDNGVFEDLTGALDDNTAGTPADINSLSSTQDRLYIGDANKFSRIIVDFDDDAGDENSNSALWSTTNSEYCSANTDENSTCDTWTNFSSLNFIDNTATSTVAMSEEGSILFDEPSGWVVSTENTSKGYWVRLRPDADFDAVVEIDEFDVADRHSKDLLIVAGEGINNDLRTAYVIWDNTGQAGWENIPGNTTAPAPWREDAGGASSALDDTGGNYEEISNFPLSVAVDLLNNAVYVAYHDCDGTTCGTTSVLTVKKAFNTVSLITAGSWTDTGFPAVTEGTGMVLNLTSDQNEIYLFYVLDPETNRLVYRRCDPGGGGTTDLCDNSADWDSERTLDVATDSIHPMAVFSKSYGDTIAIDVAYDRFVSIETGELKYERHYVDMADNTEVVAASADDAFHRDCDSGTDDQDIAGTTAKLGREADDANCSPTTVESENHVGFRFTTVNVAQGTNISSAYLDFRVNARTGSTVVDFTVYGEDVDDSAAFSALTDCTDPCSGAVGERTRTTVSTTQSIGFETQSYRIDVTDLVQEVVCRGNADAQPCVGDFNGSGTWAANNDLTLLLISAEGGTTDNFADITAEDDTATVILDPTLQINCAVASCATGNTDQDFSAGVVKIPSNSADLDHPFASSEFTSVNTNDTDFYEISASLVPSASSLATPIFQFRVNNTNNNNTDDLDATIIVKSSIPTTSKSIFLQLYNNTTATWETKVTKSADKADTDITLTATTVTGDNKYYTAGPGSGSCSGNDCWAVWRVYQDVATDGNQIFYVDHVNITFTASGPVLTQNNFLFYVDNSALDPTDIWGNPDLGDGVENTTLTAIPPGNDPMDPGDNIRIRMNISVTSGTLAASGEGFIFQYAEANDCTGVSSWTPVDVVAGGGTWRFFDNGSVADGTNLSGDPPTAGDLNLSESDRAGKYSESDATATNPFAVSAGEDLEWDWNIEFNGTAGARTYCFRMIRDDATTLSAYNTDSYPRIDTRPVAGDFMRHGRFYTTNVKRGFFWQK